MAQEWVDQKVRIIAGDGDRVVSDRQVNIEKSGHGSAVTVGVPR